MIPFPPFEPDKSPYNAGAGDNLKNLLPAADGWRPFPQWSEVSTALPSACLGAIYVRDAANNYTLIAGTQTGLYKLNTTDFTWVDIGGASAPFNVPIGDRWSFTRFGQRLVAHTLGDVIQVYDIDVGGTFSDLAGSPPRAKYSWVAGDFLVLGHLSGEPSTIHWSGINNIEHWTIGRKASDKQLLPQGDEILAGIGDPKGGVIILRNAMAYMSFAPSSGYTFTVSTVNNQRGAISPLSVVSIGAGRFCYLSEDGFYMNVEGSPIGAERIDNWFFKNIDRAYLSEVRGVADPYEKIVWWSFRDVSGTSQLLGYDWQLNRWCYADNGTEEMAALTTPFITWDGLATLYSSIDGVTEPFDSRLFKGGAPTFAAFSTDHKLGYFTGLNRAVTAQTAEIALNPQGRFFLNGCRMKTDATDFTAQVGAIDYHGQNFTWRAEVTPSARTKFVGTRADGRLHKIKINIAADGDWTTLEGVMPEGLAGGS